MELDDRFELRLSKQLKRDAEDRRINTAQICREAIQKALGQEDSIDTLIREEEDDFGKWADSFVRLYKYINNKLEARDALVVSEEAKLRQVWERIDIRMKSREQLMEEIPELRELTYEDCFDWQKVFKIIEKYPTILKGHMGLVQVREGILYREVKKGNFQGIQEARDKLRAEINLRADKVRDELKAWTQSEAAKKQWLLNQEEARIEKERQKVKT